MFGPLRSGYSVLLALVAGIWLSAAALTDYPLTTYLQTMGRGRFMLLWFLPPVLWICWLGIVVVRRRSERPTKAIARLIVRHRYWLARGFLFGLLLIPLSIAFSAFKRSIPAVVPFYADPWFADADRLLFLGHDPWTVTHAVLGPFGTLLLDRVYLLWFPSSAILLGCFLFTRDHRFQLRGLLTYVLTWFFLGSVLATAFSSVGPVYYEAFYNSDRFAPLINQLRADDAVFGLWALTIQEGLYRGFGGTFIGSGISAMPSLHVALAFLCYLAATPKLKPFAAVYVALIWVASFHLAWHYAVDGPVSIVVVAGLWWTTGRYVDRLSRVPTRNLRFVSIPGSRSSSTTG